MAPSTSAGTAANPAFSEVESPAAKSGLCTRSTVQARQRGFDLFALMPGHDDDRTSARGERLLGGDAHERLAGDLGQELVRSAHAGRAPGRQDDGGDAPALPPARLLARLRPRDDLHEQPADAHAGDVGARRPAARRAAASAPSRSRSPWASGRSRARPAPARRAPARPAAGCRDRPACRNARCARRCLDRGRDDVAPVGDGGGAEDEHELGARLQHLLDARGRARACSCGTRRSAMMLAPAGASRSAVTFSVFSTTLSARPGSSVETTPTLRST